MICGTRRLPNHHDFLQKIRLLFIIRRYEQSNKYVTCEAATLDPIMQIVIGTVIAAGLIGVVAFSWKRIKPAVMHAGTHIAKPITQFKESTRSRKSRAALRERRRRILDGLADAIIDRKWDDEKMELFSKNYGFGFQLDEIISITGLSMINNSVHLPRGWINMSDKDLRYVLYWFIKRSQNDSLFKHESLMTILNDISKALDEK